MSVDRDRDRDRDRGRDRDGEKKGAPNVEGLFTLKVDNISFRTTADIIREEFKKYGSLGDVYLPRNYSTNEPRGFAFVRFVNREDGEDALRSMDGKLVDGRELRIQEAKERRAENPKEHMQSRRDYGGGRDRDQDRPPAREPYRTRERSRDRDFGRNGREEYGRREYPDSPPRGRERERDGRDRDGGGGAYDRAERGGSARDRDRERSPAVSRRSRSRDRERDRGAPDRWEG